MNENKVEGNKNYYFILCYLLKLIKKEITIIKILFMYVLNLKNVIEIL